VDALQAIDLIDEVMSTLQLHREVFVRVEESGVLPACHREDLILGLSISSSKLLSIADYLDQ
jgi:hypothetical protein